MCLTDAEVHSSTNEPMRGERGRESERDRERERESERERNGERKIATE